MGVFLIKIVFMINCSFLQTVFGMNFGSKILFSFFFLVVKMSLRSVALVQAAATVSRLDSVVHENCLKNFQLLVLADRKVGIKQIA